MKKKILTGILLVAMSLSLVACGGKTTNDEANKTPGTEISTENVNDNAENKSEPNTEMNAGAENTEGETETSDKWVYAYSWKFPEGVIGKIDKYTNAAYPDWSKNRTHFVGTENGFVMDFSWEGPLALGECTSESTDGNTLWLETNNNDYRFAAWVDGLEDEADWAKNADKETIISWVNSVKYIDGEFYEGRETEEGYKVIFKVSNEEYTGYVCFIDDYERLEAHQFIYLEKTEIFDNERALKVVNSIFCITDYVG